MIGMGTRLVHYLLEVDPRRSKTNSGLRATIIIGEVLPTHAWRLKAATVVLLQQKQKRWTIRVEEFFSWLKKRNKRASNSHWELPELVLSCIAFFSSHPPFPYSNVFFISMWL
jgi:hypothetical protein